MSDQDDGPGADKKLPEGLQYLSKVWEPVWFLRIACVLLFADIALANLTGGGLLRWEFDLPALMNHAGYLAASLLIFCLIMSLGLPCLALCIQWMLTWLPISLSKPSLTTDEARSLGLVTLTELRDHAYAEQNQFVLNIVKLYEARFKAELAGDRELASLLFGFTALALADLCWDVGGTAKTLLATIWPSGQLGMAIFAGSLLVIGILLRECWFPPSRNWVRFPLLARALADKEAARRREVYGETDVPAYRRQLSTQFRDRSNS
ncbi:hypothetical protein [Dyella nitratireducens]|uniref:hypothetical protein n=1 Tax=Dyella nitratireducens TaxID=1849580 RepID=UPI0016695921|nr:hypothetical protein [Dyella nitratireducens]